jgi:type II secretory pathway predicted ATPase ExeA
MTRWFNIAGPCQADIHYMLPPLARLPKVERLIAQRSYFVIHAPRQVGKTTAMLKLAQQLTASGQYTAILLSVETGAAHSRLDKAEEAILVSWGSAIRAWLPRDLHPDWSSLPPANRIGTALQVWAESSPRPLVVLIDEIDSLQDEVLLGVLRQLREGASRRPTHFPHALALIGLRDVRDYKMRGAQGEPGSPAGSRLHTASPFNIKVASLTMQNFTPEEVATLYQQHTEATEQVFTPEAINHAFVLTQGQPWLVNALAKEIVEEIVPDPTQAITVEHLEAAQEILIQRRDTHIDSLAERLREDRVKAIVQPMLAGQPLGEVANDDIDFLLDLGLCRIDETGNLAIANPIYREVLPRTLAYTTTLTLGTITPSWLNASGELDIGTLLESFLNFWRQHGQPLLRNIAYHEIAPHIVLMAYLHRVVNGQGRLDREYAIGSERMDLCLRYGKVTLGIELKVWRAQRPDPLIAGLDQIDRYLAGLSLNQGWLIIFDQRTNFEPLAERTLVESARTSSGRVITVIRA